jgi:BirA family biotin operon repressor/biotin-[acetyl-CoA-carboxylase] ligase
MTALDPDRLSAGLSPLTRERLTELEVFDSIDSTNTYLGSVSAPPAGRLRVAIADSQTAGRGRLNREWVSPAGQGLYQSVAYTLTGMRDDLSALTLALGVGVLEALARCGFDAVELKWPNDLVAQDGKLGGLLTETRLTNGTLVLTAGVGINIAMDAATRDLAQSGWAQRGVALEDFGGPAPDRTNLAIAVTDAMTSVFLDYEASGFAGFVERWRRVDWLSGRAIRIESPAGTEQGIADGVDEGGALLLRTASGIRAVTAGTVSLADT